MGFRHASDNRLDDLRTKLYDWSGDEEWMEVGRYMLIRWFGDCDTFEDAISVADENRLTVEWLIEERADYNKTLPYNSHCTDEGVIIHNID